MYHLYATLIPCKLYSSCGREPAELATPQRRIGSAQQATAQTAAPVLRRPRPRRRGRGTDAADAQSVVGTDSAAAHTRVARLRVPE